MCGPQTYVNLDKKSNENFLSLYSGRMNKYTIDH